MLQCIQSPSLLLPLPTVTKNNNNNNNNNDDDNCDTAIKKKKKKKENDDYIHYNVIQKCTTNPQDSDIHVIPMGMAGEIWPYFQPNYNSCATYVSKLNCDITKRYHEQQQQQSQQQSPPPPPSEEEDVKYYNKVVAFIPTGWANGSNWNKKNSVCQRLVDLSKIKSFVDKEEEEEEDVDDDNNDGHEEIDEKNRFINVEIRLIPYSEHSTFSELYNCVEYLKPRKVIPTVFSNEKDYIAIEKRFKDLIDSKRAKQFFVNSMTMTKKKKKRLFTDTSSSLSLSCTNMLKTSNKKKEYKKDVNVMESSFGQSMAKNNEGWIASSKDVDLTLSTNDTTSCPTKKNDVVDISSNEEEEIVIIDSSDDDDERSSNNSIKETMIPRQQPVFKKTKIENDNAIITKEKLDTLVSMGFRINSAKTALTMSKDDFDLAVEQLLCLPNETTKKKEEEEITVVDNNGKARITASTNSQNLQTLKAQSSPTQQRTTGGSSSISTGSSLITSFFSLQKRHLK